MNEIKNPLRLIAPYGDRPNQIIWDILLQTVRYLKGAKSNGIRYYNCNGDPTITASSDASHAMETKGYSALGTAIHMFGGPMITARRGIGGGGNQSAAFAGAGFSTANVTCTEEYS